MSLEKQMFNEEVRSKHHTVAMVKAMMPELRPHVNDYILKVNDFYDVPEEDFYYDVKGETRHWETKETRYKYMLNQDITDLCWNVVIHSITSKSATFCEVIGRVYKQLDLEERQAIETVGEMIGILAETPFISIVRPKFAESEMLEITSHVNLTQEVQAYLDKQNFVLPSLVPPKIVTKNTDSGYRTFNDGLILGGKMHDKPINYAHLNRTNSVGLRINDDVIRRVDPVFKEKDGETKEERKERHDQWLQLNTESVQLYAEFTNKIFYLTNRYDERCRTYARGHHFNPQGDNYRKAVIEFANQEVTKS